MFTDGIGAEFFVASGGGAVYGGDEVKAYGGKECALQYDLQGVAKIDGALITMRVPLEPPSVDIYKYVEQPAMRLECTCGARQSGQAGSRGGARSRRNGAIYCDVKNIPV